MFFWVVLFSKRSFVGSAQLILIIKERFFTYDQACLSVFLTVLFSKLSLYNMSIFQQMYEALINDYKNPFIG
jgi:hypothetical protein